MALQESNLSINLRQATIADAQEAAELFLNTVRKVNARDYSPAQIKAWAPATFTVERMIDKINNTKMFVAEDGKEIVGIGSLSAPNYLDLLYVRHDRIRQGIGKALMEVLENEAVRLGADEILSNVSITAKAAFLASGYTVTAEQQVEINGQRLANFRMRKSLHIK